MARIIRTFRYIPDLDGYIKANPVRKTRWGHKTKGGMFLMNGRHRTLKEQDKTVVRIATRPFKVKDERGRIRLYETGEILGRVSHEDVRGLSKKNIFIPKHERKGRKVRGHIRRRR